MPEKLFDEGEASSILQQVAMPCPFEKKPYWNYVNLFAAIRHQAAQISFIVHTCSKYNLEHKQMSGESQAFTPKKVSSYLQVNQHSHGKSHGKSLEDTVFQGFFWWIQLCSLPNGNFHFWIYNNGQLPTFTTNEQLLSWFKTLSAKNVVVKTTFTTFTSPVPKAGNHKIQPNCPATVRVLHDSFPPHIPRAKKIQNVWSPAWL